MKNELKKLSEDLGSEVEIEAFQKELSMAELIKDCYFPNECYKACSECKNFGNLWCCPPYEDSMVELFKNHNIEIYVTRINFDKNQQFKGDKLNLYSRTCRTVHQELLQKEKETGGLAFSFVGECPFCPPGSCTRLEGKPCRHPDKARRSLEGIGFNISKILSKYFDLALDWSDNGDSYSYLTFVAGLIH